MFSLRTAQQGRVVAESWRISLGETERETDRETDRQTDRETDRERCCLFLTEAVWKVKPSTERFCDVGE